jgi:plasmid maintenance system antidote protein VapI
VGLTRRLDPGVGRRGRSDLNGNRSLTKEQVIKLAKFFHVSPAAFLPA